MTGESRSPAGGRLGGVAGIIAPLAFTTSWVAAGAIRDGYDPVRQGISELAALGAPHRWLVTAGMVTFGAGSLAFSRCFRRAASVSLVVAGVASFGVAALPCSPGCPGSGSFTDTGHGIAAATHYVALSVTPLLAGRSAANVTASTLGGVALALHGIGVGPSGALQRIGLTTLDLWMAATAARLLRRRSEVRPGAPERGRSG